MLENKTRPCLFCGELHPEGAIHLTAGDLGDRCLLEVAEQIRRRHAREARLAGGNGPAAEVPSEPFVPSLPTPDKLADLLSERVIGQPRAIRSLSVAVWQHYERFVLAQQDGEARLDKTNVLLIGPSGTGKTELARALADVLDVPLSVTDAASLTAPGYIGGDVEECLERLVRAADGEVARAERGIVFLDEIDKKATRPDSRHSRDVGGDDVQSALLALLEGSTITYGGQGPRDATPRRRLRTHDIMFICAGAFEGLTDIVADRLARQARAPIGFAGVANPFRRPSEADLLAQVQPADLEAYGLKRELVGRLHVVTSTAPLDVEALVLIQRDPPHALVRQYRALMESFGLELDVAEGTLEAVAEVALSRGTGARGLRSIWQAMMEKPLSWAATFSRIPSIRGVRLEPQNARGQLPAMPFGGTGTARAG